MIKVRLRGEPDEVKEFAEWLERTPCAKVLQRSEGYPDRGKSKYERVYMDVKLTPPARINKDFEELFEAEDFDDWLEKHPGAVIQGHSFDNEKSTAEAEENKRQGDLKNGKE